MIRKCVVIIGITLSMPGAEKLPQPQPTLALLESLQELRRTTAKIAEQKTENIQKSIETTDNKLEEPEKGSPAKLGYLAKRPKPIVTDK